MVFLFLVVVSNVQNQECADIDGNKLFVVAIENFKMIQNAIIYEFKTIISPSEVASKYIVEKKKAQ